MIRCRTQIHSNHYKHYKCQCVRQYSAKLDRYIYGQSNDITEFIGLSTVSLIIYTPCAPPSLPPVSGITTIPVSATIYYINIYLYDDEHYNIIINKTYYNFSNEHACSYMYGALSASKRFKDFCLTCKI